MTSTPRVSIVIPVFDDEEWVASALRSCTAQTVADIEIICVDDASSDGTCAVIERAIEADARISLMRQPSNMTAFQARREGIMAASAPRLMFLDGDDELAPNAVEIALDVAETSGADLVGFGVETIMPNGQRPGRFSQLIQPVHAELFGDDIVTGLFPTNQIAQGQLWRYLWMTAHLRQAYGFLAEDLMLPRANDVPIAFLSIAAARHYVSTDAQLYRYFFRRGGSGRDVIEVEDFEFYLGALDSISSIEPGVEALCDDRSDPDSLLQSYRNACLGIIQSILRYCVPIDDRQLQGRCYELLHEKADSADIVVAAAKFYREALPFLAEYEDDVHALNDQVRTVLIVAGNLGSGGVQGVVISQAQYLRDAGYRVIVAARTMRDRVHEVPTGVELVEIVGSSIPEKLDSYIEICRSFDVDAIIDHWILYNDDFPYFALAARALGTPTIGWLHNFALRPIFDFNSKISLLSRYLPTLAKVVVLSKTDVAFWQLRGIRNVVYLPNPPSPLLLRLPQRVEPREAPTGPLHLVWWGRLQQHTKRVRSIIDVASELRRLEVDFDLTIIGPDSKDLKFSALRAYAREKGVEDVVILHGPLHGEALLETLEEAHIFVCTSAIEGYPLVLTEAQALGMPVAMYELPWLAVLDGNDGIASVPQGDARALANEIRTIGSAAEVYRRRSQNSITAASGALAYDFQALYSQLLLDELPAEFRPEPTTEDAGLLLRLAIEYDEASSAREGRYERRLVKDRDDQRNKAAKYKRALDAERRAGEYRESRIAELSKQLEWSRRALEAREGSTLMAANALVSRNGATIRAYERDVRNRGIEVNDRLDRLEALLVLSHRDTLLAMNDATNVAIAKLSREQRGRKDADGAKEPVAVRAVRPAGRALLRIAPALRPIARRFNRLVRKL